MADFPRAGGVAFSQTNAQTVQTASVQPDSDLSANFPNATDPLYTGGNAGVVAAISSSGSGSNLRIQFSFTAPTARTDGTALGRGDLWVDENDDIVYIYNGTAYEMLHSAHYADTELFTATMKGLVPPPGQTAVDAGDHYLRADGDWASVTGTGGAFDLHADVTTEVDNLADDDRFVISDVSETGEPNRYVTTGSIKTDIYRTTDARYQQLAPLAEGLRMVDGAVSLPEGNISMSARPAQGTNIQIRTSTNINSNTPSWGFFDTLDFGNFPGSSEHYNLVGSTTQWTDFFTGSLRYAAFNFGNPIDQSAFFDIYGGSKDGVVIELLGWVANNNYAIWHLRGGAGEESNMLYLGLHAPQLITSQGSPNANSVRWMFNLTSGSNPTISQFSQQLNPGDDVLLSTGLWGKVGDTQLLDSSVGASKLDTDLTFPNGGITQASNRQLLFSPAIRDAIGNSTTLYTEYEISQDIQDFVGMGGTDGKMSLSVATGAGGFRPNVQLPTTWSTINSLVFARNDNTDVESRSAASVQTYIREGSMIAAIDSEAPENWALWNVNSQGHIFGDSDIISVRVQNDVAEGNLDEFDNNYQLGLIDSNGTPNTTIDRKYTVWFVGGHQLVSGQKIVDNSVEERTVRTPTAGSNGQFLQKQSGARGGWTWVSASTDSEIATVNRRINDVQNELDAGVGAFPIEGGHNSFVAERQFTDFSVASDARSIVINTYAKDSDALSTLAGFINNSVANSSTNVASLRFGIRDYRGTDTEFVNSFVDMFMLDSTDGQNAVYSESANTLTLFSRISGVNGIVRLLDANGNTISSPAGVDFGGGYFTHIDAYRGSDSAFVDLEQQFSGLGDSKYRYGNQLNNVTPVVVDDDNTPEVRMASYSNGLIYSSDDNSIGLNAQNSPFNASVFSYVGGQWRYLFAPEGVNNSEYVAVETSNNPSTPLNNDGVVASGRFRLMSGAQSNGTITNLGSGTALSNTRYVAFNTTDIDGNDIRLTSGRLKVGSVIKFYRAADNYVDVRITNNNPFPNTAISNVRQVEVLDSQGNGPSDTSSRWDAYIRSTEVMPVRDADIINGAVTGAKRSLTPTEIIQYASNPSAFLATGTSSAGQTYVQYRVDDIGGSDTTYTIFYTFSSGNPVSGIVYPGALTAVAGDAVATRTYTVSGSSTTWVDS